MLITLSRRENEVAAQIVLGKTEKEVAIELFVSTDTVHTHKKRIFKKLGARNIADLTRIYISQLLKEDVAKIIRENVIEANLKKVSIMILALGLQFSAMVNELDCRRPARVTRTVKSRTGQRGRKDTDYLI